MNINIVVRCVYSLGRAGLWMRRVFNEAISWARGVECSRFVCPSGRARSSPRDKRTQAAWQTLFVSKVKPMGFEKPRS